MKNLWFALRSYIAGRRASPPPPPYRPALSPEEAAKWYRVKTVAEAKAVALADGVYTIVFYNRQHSASEQQGPIDPFKVFESESRENVQDWINRTEKLLATNYAVGDAVVGKSHQYESLRAEYIATNPGFSTATYEHAIYLGACKAVH